MKTLFKVWSFLDGLYFSCSRLEYVNKKTKNIFRVKLLTYRGKSIALSNGTYIRANDVLLKIHLHNCLLMSEIADIKNDTKRAIYVYQRVKSSMPGLADFIRNHPKTEKIKGIIGVTILSRGVSRLGFEVKDIPNPYYRAMRQSYMKPIFLLCHAGKNVSRKPENLVPKVLIMPKDRIFSQYLQQV